MSRKSPKDQDVDPSNPSVEPPAPDAGSDKPSFAERVGQRAAARDPFLIATDLLAGVHLFESRRDRQMAIKFDEKPGKEVIDTVKDAGYRWQNSSKIWAYPVQPNSASTNRIEAERLYEKVRHLVRQAKGVEASPEVPF